MVKTEGGRKQIVDKYVGKHFTVFSYQNLNDSSKLNSWVLSIICEERQILTESDSSQLKIV